MNFTLELLPDTFAICRSNPDATISEWVQEGFVSITRTKDELSVICRQNQVPNDVQCEAGWRCLRLAGRFDLSEVGVLASLTNPLAEARVSVLVVGTFDTDYMLVKAANLESAVDALEKAGHSVRDT